MARSRNDSGAGAGAGAGARMSGSDAEIISRLIAIQQEIVANRRDKEPEKIPLIDPTANVISLVALRDQRQDDLRTAEGQRLDQLRNQESMWAEKLRVQQARCEAELQAEVKKGIEALALAESRRLDAVLAEQKNAVALAAEKTSAQASTLAQSVIASAEALRAQVATTTATTTALITQLRESLEKRVQIVEQNQYAAGGANVQKSEGRQVNQWVIGLAVIIGIAIVGFLLRSIAGH